MNSEINSSPEIKRPNSVERSILPEVDSNLLSSPENILSLGQEVMEQTADNVRKSKKLIKRNNKQKQKPVVKQDADDDNDKIDVEAPDTAKDSHKIEREWIESAKAVLSETKDDPKQREDKITDLKYDYLKKRYNHRLGDGVNRV